MGILPGRGRKPGDNLSYKQQQIVLLHLEGYSSEEISKELQTTPGYVGNVLQFPESKAMIREFSGFIDIQLSGLEQLGVNALKEALLGEDMRLKVDVAKTILKKHLETVEQTKETAEDVVKRMIQMYKDGSVTMSEEVRTIRRNIDSSCAAKEVITDGE